MLNRRMMLASVVNTCGAAPLVAAAFQDEPAPRRRGRRGATRGEGTKIAVFDSMMQSVLEECHVVGATLAVAKDGRLVHAHGYGLADREAGAPVEPATLFCLASCTKPVTAVAALKLVDDGKLLIDTPVADILSDVKPLPGERIVDPRVRDITVRHLMLHASGLPHDLPAEHRGVTDDGDDEGKPDEALMAYRRMLGTKLDFKPGHEHKYSNFGFVVLRLVVERVGGKPYEEFAKQSVLRPMGIGDMRMEADHHTRGETQRYLPNGRLVLRWNAANWLASATDMVRFMTAVAGTRGKPFLSDETRKLMLAPPPPPIKENANGGHVGLGWDTVQETQAGPRFSKNGGKPGVAAWIEHLARGIDWAVMFNTARPGQPAPAPLPTVRRAFMQAIEHLEEWPDVDLFQAT